MTTAVAHEVHVDGGALACWSWGPADGPLVVAAHGITSSHVFWSRIGPELAERGIRLVAPDLRGRGLSADLPGPSSLARHAADLLAVADAEGRSDVVLAGHSMGGFVVATAAAAHPDRVTAAVLVDGGPPLGPPLGPDADVEGTLRAVIGPSLDRLDQRVASPEEYRGFWRGHPSLAGVDRGLVDAYADHDLVEDEPGSWRSRVSREAVIDDGRDTLVSDALQTAVVDAARAGVPVSFLRASRAMRSSRSVSTS